MSARTKAQAAPAATATPPADAQQIESPLQLLASLSKWMTAAGMGPDHPWQASIARTLTAELQGAPAVAAPAPVMVASTERALREALRNCDDLVEEMCSEIRAVARSAIDCMCGDYVNAEHTTLTLLGFISKHASELMALVNSNCEEVNPTDGDVHMSRDHRRLCIAMKARRDRVAEAAASMRGGQ